MDNQGVQYAKGVTAFTATKQQRRVMLSMTVEDRSLREPVSQTLTGEIVLRNEELAPPEF